MLQVRSMMESRNFLPSTVTYNNLIHGFIVAGNHAEAVETFQAMMADAASSLDRRSQCAPDLATYNILIDMYAKLSDATSAAQMLDQMTKHGIAPDVVSFNTVMDAYRRIGDTENVRFYFDAIGRQAMRPTEVSHNILISAYGFNGEPGIAQELFKQMYAKGVYPRRGLQGDFAGAMAMFERMQYSGIKPDARIYAMLMQAAVRSSVGLAKVDDVFKMAESDGHVNRDVCHWLMLAALADGTRPLAEVVQAVYVDEMQIRKIAPTVQTLDMLIDAVMRPSRLLELHDGLVHQKYRTLSKMGYAGAVGGAGSAIAAKTSSVSTNVDGGTAGKSANASALERVVRDLQTAGHRLSDRQRSRIAAAARRLSAQ
ncbi:hypothetical protein BC831DRAFT_473394 [Entophlyctis helioformis]|nr:hypothetical protein BC831DRAFT_473394 [Entophlyctis helioformis]